MHLRRLTITRDIYDARAMFPFDGHTNAVEVSQGVDLLCNLEPNLEARICDVGCGGGWHLLELHRRGYSYLYGIDLSAKSLAVASRVCNTTRAILSLQDISTSSLTEFFDVVTVFNATLGSGNYAFDRSFVRGAARQLRPGGRLLLTYLPRELAATYVGHFSVSYSIHSKEIVNSFVKFNPRNSELCIHQKIGGETLPLERLRLYSISEMESLLSDAGLVIGRSISSSEEQLESFGISWIIATRPNV